MRRVMGVVVGTAFGLALVANCGAPGGGVLTDMGHTIGDMEVAAADLLGIDLAGLDLTGVDLAGFGVTDAAAAAPMVADCDKVWNFRPGADRTEYHYAEFAVPGFNPTAPEHVTATICEPTSSNTVLALRSCVGTFNCDAALSGSCQAATISSMDVGVIRVDCGFTSYSGNVAGTSAKWGKAYLKVGP
jgi:hypothetical protein